MSLSTDFTARGVSQKRVQVSTDKLLGGTTSHLSEAIPWGATHIALIPEAAGVHVNFGAAATASTFLLPLGGIVFNAGEVALESIHLYAASATYVHVLIGGNSCKIVLGTSLATGDISVGNVGLLDTGETEIDPSEAQAANTAYAAADKLTPLGGVKSAARHTAAELETFADDDYVPVGVTAVHELRVRDDDANTDFDSLLLLLAVGTGAMASAQAVTIATDDTVIGATDASVVAAGAVGSLSAKLRRLTTDLGAASADLNELTAAPIEKTPVLVVQAIATVSTAEALIGSETFARVLHLQARKVAGDNTGNVFVGLSDLDQSVAELFELTPGAVFDLEMPAGTKVDLNDIFIDADTQNDGVVGWYIPV